jgi:hypothetical protein
MSSSSIYLYWASTSPDIKFFIDFFRLENILVFYEVIYFSIWRSSACLDYSVEPLSTPLFSSLGNIYWA